MLPYVASIMSTSFFAWFYQIMNNIEPHDYRLRVFRRVAPMFLVLSFLSVFILSAFRVDVGIDFGSYVDWFNNLYEYDYAYFEPGFTATIQFIQLFTLDAQWLFIVSSLITLLLVFVSVKKYSPMFALSIFLFCTMGFLSHSFNLTRQFIAISILLFAYGYLVDKKMLKYMAAVVLASLFHKTALIMLPMYFLLRSRFRVLTWLAIGLGALLMTIFQPQVTSFVVNNFYPQYYDSEFVGESIGSTYYTLLSMALIAAVVFFVHKKRLKMDTAKERIIVNLVLAVALLHIVLNWVPLSNRVSLYFDILLLIAIPQLVVLIKDRLRRRIVVLVIIAYFSLAAFLSFSGNANGVLPYNTSLLGYTGGYHTLSGSTNV